MLRVDMHEPPSVSRILRTLGFGGSPRAVRMSGGTDTQVWHVQGSAEPAMLRIYPAGAEAAQEKEEAFLRHLGGQGLPVPQVWASGVLAGDPFLLLSVCAGRPVGLELRASPWKAYQLGVRAGEMQARVHLAPVTDALRPFGHPWRAALVDEPLLRDRLDTVPPLPDTLLHMDFHPLNLLTDGARITGAIDWISAAVGDPRHDIARTLVLLRCPRTDRAYNAPFIRGVSRVFERGWLEGYARTSRARPALAAALGEHRTQAVFLACASVVMAWEMRRIRRRADLERMRHLTRVWKHAARLPAPPVRTRWSESGWC